MKALQILGLALGLATLGSCQKDANFPANRPSNFKDLEASANFNWEAHQKVTVEISATQVPSTIKRTLTITTDQGNVVYKGLYQMNTPFQTALMLAKDVKELSIQYGSIEKTESIQSGKCGFNMILPAAAYGSF